MAPAGFASINITAKITSANVRLSPQFFKTQVTLFSTVFYMVGSAHQRSVVIVAGFTIAAKGEIEISTLSV